MRTVLSWLVGLSALALAACASSSPDLPAPPVHANGGALWKIIDTQCLPGLKDRHDPAPCEAVSLDGGQAHGFVLLKDRDGVAQYLLMPTAKITGIEDPLILAPDAQNYFARAWEARGSVETKLGKPLPRDEMTVAINSLYGRSQDQLHLHIDCIDPQTKAELKAIAPQIGPRWTSQEFSLHGQPYHVRRLTEAELAINPFFLLRDQMPGASAYMGAWTLALIGDTDAQGRPDFLLIAARADPAHGHKASAEDLQDHACAVAKAG